MKWLRRTSSVARTLFCVTAAAASAVAQTPFGPALLMTGPGPAWVAAGDLDGDSRTDLACTNSGDGTISVFLTSPTGVLHLGAALPAIQSSPAFVDIELADLDRDGRLDVLAASKLATTSAVAVYHNLGGGTFASPVTYQVGVSCSALAVGDLDGDLWPDVAISNAGNPSTLKVLLNNAAGVLLAPSVIPLANGALPADVELADLDGDGDRDLVTTSGTNLAVLLNNGSATFAGPQLYPAQSNLLVVRLGDWNNDNRPDAAVVKTAGAVAVMLNNGSGAFGAPNNVLGNTSTVSDLVVGDLNGDSRPDLASDNHSGDVRVCLGLGGGAFGPQTTFISGGWSGLAIADVDGDGRADVVAARDQPNQLAVLLGDGHGNLGNGIPESLAASEFVWGDFNGDGRVDVAGPRPTSSQIAVRLALPTGGFGPETLFADGSPNSLAAAGYVDADANLDLLTRGGDKIVRVLFGDGAGGFAAPVSAGLFTLTNQNVLGDVTGDGLADYVYAYAYLDSSGVLQYGTTVTFGDGAGGFAYLTSEGFAASSIVIADFNEDGASDVALSDTGYVALRPSYGGGLASPLYSTASQMTAMVAGDIDGDGHLDLIGATGYSGVGVQLGDGQANLSTQVTYAGPAYTTEIAAADFDGDGDLDVVAGYDDYLGFFEGDGTGALNYRGAVLFGGGFLDSLAVGDGNSDGRVDVIAGNLASVSLGTVHVVYNRGSSGAPSIYCTAKTTSNGCVPSISSSGTPSATATSGFTIACSNVINGKSGLLFYSLTGRAQIPFQSGTMCVRAPRQRTPLLNSGGNPPPDDCSGLFALDLNAFAHGLAGGSPASALTIPGSAVTAQWWGRDPLSIPNQTMLSNAIDFIVHP